MPRMRLMNERENCWPADWPARPSGDSELRKTAANPSCRKSGFLEQHATFGAAAARDAEIEAGSSAAHPASEFAIPPLMVMPVAPVFLPFVALAVAVSPPTPLPDPPFAYRPLPQLFLVPATFDSASARDAFFDSLRAKLEAAAAAQRANIDQHCRFWPCTPSDVSCPDPVCERQRALVDEQLKTRLDQLPAQRAQTKIVVPSEASSTTR